MERTRERVRSRLLLLLLTVVWCPVLGEAQEYQTLSGFLSMKESDFKQLCTRKGIVGTFQITISGSLQKLYGYFNDFSTIPADSGYEIAWSKKFYGGKALYLDIKQLVPLIPKDSIYRFFLNGHQRIKNVPSFLSTDGQGFFEITISPAEPSVPIVDTCDIHVSVSYWIYANPAKLELIRSWRRTQGKYLNNPDYPDPVEAEIVEKFLSFFRYLETHIQLANLIRIERTE